MFNSVCMCRTGIQDRAREKGGGAFGQNILVGGKEEESSGREKAEGWIFLPVFSSTFDLIRNQCAVKVTPAYR